MVRAVLFDCFGVIITDALRQVIEEIDTSDHQISRQVMGIIHAYNRGLVDITETNQQIAALLGISTHEWQQRLDKGEIKDDRVLTYIRALRQRGYKTALLSNIGRQSLHHRFTEDELHAHFDAVVTSGELGIMKPDPEIYLHTAEQLGVAPDDCIMVDDRETHCVGARAVGMQSLLFRNFRQAKQALEQMLR